jgi:hypothetical protein
MNRLVIFTAGTSLLENLRNEEKLNKREVYKNLNLDRLTGDAWSILADAAFVRKRLLRCIEEFAPLDLGNDIQLAYSTAEIASYYRLTKKNDTGGDRLVLLCSDTVEGAFSALVNALLLSNGEILCRKPSAYSGISGLEASVRPINDLELPDERFHSTLKTLRQPRIEIQVVPDLYPDNKMAFERYAIANLASAIATLHFGKQTGLHTVLNYTGGFKAAIPILSQSVAVAGDIDMVCLYEQASELIYQQLVPIELLPETENRLRNAVEKDGYFVLEGIRGADNLARQAWHPAEKALYWVASSGDIRLTPLGLALRAMVRKKRDAMMRAVE